MGGEFNEEIIKEFEKITKDARRVQEETLKAILQRNAGTEYLQKYGLNGRTDVESFKSCVPLVTHADIFPWIQRIADGDTSPILAADPITVLSLSSGTSEGRPKYIPFNQDLLDSTLQMFRLAAAYRARAFPTKPGGRILEFIYSGKQFYTKGGLVAGTATTNYFRSEHFKQKQRSTKAFTCSPEEVILGSDSQQSMYCHFLCGLLYSNEVEFVTSTFAYSIVEAFRMLEQVWEELCNDIKEGTLSQRITITSMREAMSKILVSNPELAEAIHEKTSKLENWHGVIEQLWPNAKYVYSIMTGAMEPYLKKLRHYAGSLPLLSADYGATEGWIGVNLNPRHPPQTTTFTVVPNFAFFEFIPLSQHVEDGQVDGTIAISHSRELQPVGLTEVKVGQEYEVVFTTFAGLYRYKLGDVVKVTGFYNSSPQLAYVCRKNLLLTVNIDKNTEKDLQMVVDKASQPLNEETVELVDFTSYVDHSTEPGHYVIFWELSGGVNGEVLKKCCSIIDQSFVDPGYVGSRKIKTIGPLELRIVKRGTFRRILNHYLTLGATIPREIDFMLEIWPALHGKSGPMVGS
eukprot:Gb_14667 [translate_table: standard]